MELLNRYGLQAEQVSEDEWKLLCPFHDDNTPSLFFNSKKRVFKCHACEVTGTIYDLLAKVTGLSKRDAMLEFTLDNPIRVETIEQYVKNLRDGTDVSLHLRTELYNRCITDEIIDYYRLGRERKRVTIPIKSPSGYYVNIRKYLPGGKSKKVVSQVDRGHNTLYPFEQMRYEYIVLCGGELKALLSAYHLNQYNIGAVSPLHGEHHLPTDLAELFAGKRVFICMDVDHTGEVAAHNNAIVLYKYTQAVHIVKLPLDTKVHPKGDVNDYFAGGQTSEAYYNLIMSSAQFDPAVNRRKLVQLQPAEHVTLSDIIKDGALHGRHIATTGRVVSIRDAPISIPKHVKVHCEQDHALCIKCPRYNADEVFQIDNRDKEFVKYVESCNDTTAKSILGIPISCKASKIEVKDYYSIHEMNVARRLELRNFEANNDERLQRLYSTDACSDNLEYSFSGFAVPDKHNNLVIISHNTETVESAIDTFQLRDDISSLEVFRADSSNILPKLRSIVDNIAARVTRIFDRPYMHLVADLTFHCPLFFYYESNRPHHGWMSNLIVGDSAAGKTTMIESLLDYYALGTRLSCKNASRAGLLGGVDKQGNGQNFVRWGIFPQYDKQVVVLDELSGLDKEVFAELTDMRSSGRAEVGKIVTRTAPARTRMLALSNPRYEMTLGQISPKVKALKPLIGAPEDIRRFDLVDLEAEKKVDNDIRDKMEALRAEDEIYKREDFRELILWCWTLKPEDIIINSFNMQYIDWLKDKYSNPGDIPLIDPGSVLIKVLRIAVTLAARTFNINDNRQCVVEDFHVYAAVILLDQMYSSEHIGYYDHNLDVKERSTIHEPAVVRALLQETVTPTERFKKWLLATTDFTRQDFNAQIGFIAQGGIGMLEKLMAQNAIKASGPYKYVKTEPFVEMLRQELRG